MQVVSEIAFYVVSLRPEPVRPIMIALALTTTTFGTLLPVLRDAEKGRRVREHALCYVRARTGIQFSVAPCTVTVSRSDRRKAYPKMRFKPLRNPPS